MKKSLYFGFAALSALAFTACQKEVAVNEPSKEMVTVTLKAEKPGDATRTAAVEGTDKVSYEWTAEDKANLKVFIVGEDDKGNEKLTEVTDRVVSISDDNKVLTVTATVEESSTLRTAVSNAWTGSNKPKINANQSPKTDNYDAGADVIVAADVTVEDGLDEALLDFSRPVTINKMTLKNMVAGEKVYEVKITSDQHLTGYYENGVMKAQDQTLTLTYDDVVVGTNGEFPVYFVAMPKEGHTLTVTVKSDRFVYSKTFGPVNFTVGKFSKFGVKLPAGEPVVDTDYTGDWVITGMNGNAAFAAQAYVDGDNNLKALGVNLDKDNEKILSTKVDEIKMHFAKVTEGDYSGLYTIQDASGNYLYASSSNANQLKGAASIGGNDYYWSVEKESNGTYSIKAAKSSNHNIMQFNSGSSLFSCYASAGQKPVTLYPYSWVEEDGSAQPSGTGTLDDPYNALAAIAAVKDLNWTSNTDYETTDEVYVKGKISRIASKGTYTEGGTYGNASFYISDDGGAVNEFYCYRVLYLGNKKFVEGQTDIKVGDDVIVYGKLMNYKGNTPETVSGSAYLYSLNGKTGDEPAEEFTITISDSEHGTVSASATKAIAGTEITLTVSPATGYELNTLTVTDAAGAVVAVTGNKFTMPASNVTVTATFKEEQQEEDGEWVLVTDASSLAEGDVIVVAAYNITYRASGVDYVDNKVMGAINASNLGTPIDVTFNEDGTEIITLPNGAQQISLEGDASGWALKNASGLYLKSGDKKLFESEDSSEWTISISDGNATISQSTYKLQYNPNSGNGRFAAYSSSQKLVRLYRKN